ncbi:hypothetical protein D9M73_82590 [compost metagenome]|nr:MAG TPA: hypothetical protein [Caudoviricetes sp.]
MGIILGALGGAGKELSNIAEQNTKYWNEQELQTQRSNLETQKAIAVAKAAQEIKDAPLNRIGAMAQSKLGEEVPISSTPVTTLSGNDAGASNDESGQRMSGFTGDLAKARSDVMGMTEGPDKVAALAQLDRQVAGDQAEADKGIIGKTRKRTSQEALDAAVDEARVKDLPAVAEYEARIGKPERDERRVGVQETREENRARQAQVTEARRLAVDMAKMDLQQGSLDAQNRKIDAWIDNESMKRDNDATKAENGGKGQSPDKLGAIINASNATIKNLNENGKGKTPKAQADWQTQMDNAMKVRARATQLLNQSLIDRGADSDKPTAPGAGNPSAPAGLPQGARQVGTSGGKPVYETPDGKRFIQK